jgi:hypothetical protein
MIKIGSKEYKQEEVGHYEKYDTHYLISTGEWLEKIGFCDDKENCSFCLSYKEDGSPKSYHDIKDE